MKPQYANLNGRRYVNSAFIGKLREAYPVTTKKIPLGYSTYTGWTGQDEVLFTEHSPLEDAVKIDGQVYEVTPNPANPDAFDKEILGAIKHAVVKVKKASGARRRMSRDSDDLRILAAKWGETLTEAVVRGAGQTNREAAEGRRVARSRRAEWMRKHIRVERRREATAKDWIAWDPSDD